ncbi:hypothetical protein ASE86_01340 [Sphingomonas sp. Leaf33]|uniref:type II toxin-antitoxin system RelE/ParE family toxin n=1 Tax=Sphingomonas sp. Leaf33 TaxID=1736215 RepID=UPI0006F29C1B|nr:type II toxin-antitoxin system RelE/ParE family toxin [Sphingomonas sp. Leaf33]KQN24951.1 hypothetical protein ASE86_01340 [Sphingomonas sp. Leaf33]
MADVIWRVAALDDLDEAIAYIERHDPAAAERYRTRLILAGENLRDFPHRGRPAAVPEHREVATVPPYVISYTIEDDTVFIRSIRHGRRRPFAD